MKRSSFAFVSLWLIVLICLSAPAALAQKLTKTFTPSSGASSAASRPMTAGHKYHAATTSSIVVNGWTVNTGLEDGIAWLEAYQYFCCEGIYETNLPPVSYNFNYVGLDIPPVQDGITAANYAADAAQNPPPLGGSNTTR